jgi:hypothetical protein
MSLLCLITLICIATKRCPSLWQNMNFKNEIYLGVMLSISINMHIKHVQVLIFETKLRKKKYWY